MGIQGGTERLALEPTPAHNLIVDAIKTLPVPPWQRVHGEVEFAAFGVPKSYFLEHPVYRERGYWEEKLKASGVVPWQGYAFCFDVKSGGFKPDRSFTRDQGKPRKSPTEGEPIDYYVNPKKTLNRVLESEVKPHFIRLDMDDDPPQEKWGYENFRKTYLAQLLNHNYLPFEGSLQLGNAQGFGKDEGYYGIDLMVNFDLGDGRTPWEYMNFHHFGTGFQTLAPEFFTDWIAQLSLHTGASTCVNTSYSIYNPHRDLP